MYTTIDVERWLHDRTFQRHTHIKLQIFYNRGFNTRQILQLRKFVDMQRQKFEPRKTKFNGKKFNRKFEKNKLYKSAYLVWLETVLKLRRYIQKKSSYAIFIKRFYS